nr:hypothetical protein [Tanacetum cinerariifolium]
MPRVGAKDDPCDFLSKESGQNSYRGVLAHDPCDIGFVQYELRVVPRGFRGRVTWDGRVSPARRVRRSGIKGKLSPRFIGPFEILDRVGKVSYRLALPPQLSHVHNVFHVSLLRGTEDILDRQDRVMRNKTIPFVKILWRNHSEREATWET